MKKTIKTIVLCVVIILLSTCTMVLNESLEGGSSGDGGVLDPILDILEEELVDSYDADRGLDSSLPGNVGSRSLAGGANSILHTLPTSSVGLVIDHVDTHVRNLGLGRSRDLEKVLPAVAEATVDALIDDSIVGTDITEEELVDIHAVSIRAMSKAINAPSVTNLAEGLGTAEEKTDQIEALITKAGDSFDSFGFSTENAADALQKMVWVVSETGNVDVEDLSTTEASTTLTDRMNFILNKVSQNMDNSSLFTGADCANALNGLVNAAVYGLGGTSFSSAGDTVMQEVVRDGILTGLFYAFYGFDQNVGLSSDDLKNTIDLVEALAALGAGSYYDSVSTNINSELSTTLVPEALNAARLAYIIESPTGVSGNVTANAVQASTVSSGTTTTWTANSEIYVSSDLSVNGNLVIEEGAIIYINTGADISISSTGTIHATGSLGNPVIFTRAYSGNWGNINIYDSLGNSFSYCDISEGTDGIMVDGGLVNIDNCRIHSNGSNALDFNLAVADINEVSTVTDSYFYDNGSYPVRTNQYFDLDESNHFYNPDEATEPDLAAAYNAVEITNNLERNMTLGITEIPYYVSDATWNVTGVLTVSPGVVMKFASDADVRIESRITAEGTTAEPIIFTSVTNSDAGGDTDGGGNAGTAGDWLGFDLLGADNVFTNCEFSYATRAVDFNDYTNEQGSAVFDSCRFHHNSENGIEGSETMSGSSGSSVTNSEFWDNGEWPVIMNQYLSMDDTNHFYDSETASAPDLSAPYNAISFYGDIDNEDVTFVISEVPYRVNETVFTIDSPGSLTVSPGGIVKFIADADIRISSKLTANGTGTGASERIVFTSITDSTVGGDTDGSGDAGTPGDWLGLDLLGADSEFTYCTLTYAQIPIDFNDYTNSQGSAVINYCTVQHNSNGGIDATEAMAGTVISNSTFSDNNTTASGPYDIDIAGNSNVSTSGNTTEFVNP